MVSGQWPELGGRWEVAGLVPCEGQCWLGGWGPWEPLGEAGWGRQEGVPGGACGDRRASL